jgi:class 3 adenylate cyclase
MSPPAKEESPRGAARHPPPFVNRAREHKLLERWAQEATSGQPRVVFIEGEAGIGKSRLLQEVRSLAQRLRMEVHICRCYEDLALPYLPFAESLLPRLASIPTEEMPLGDGLQSIAELLNRSRSAAEAPSTSTGSGPAEYDKLQLFLTVARAVVVLAQTTPTFLVIEDLHWADRQSLDLLEHVIFTVADTAMREPIPLLVVATHRPVQRDDRLTRLAARLQREEISRTLMLEGLSEPEVHELIGGLGVARPSHQLTARVSEATDGNPLFVQEVMHHLRRRDALQEQGGFLVTTADATDLPLPEEITSAIAARAGDLSAACRRVLTLASALGETFSSRVLSAVSAMPETELLDLLEEGMRQQVLRSEDDAFQFAHPLFRHVFYQEPSAPRRRLVHKQVAESLQQLYGDSADPHVLEIAHHLVRAGSSVAPGLIVEQARRAADHAFRMFAWSDAARYYEAALAAAGGSQLSIKERADLQYWAGLAHYHDQDVGPCLHHYDLAIAGYRLSGDRAGLARALMERTRTQFTLAAVPLGTLADLKPLEEALSALGEGEPGLRGHIAAVISEAYRNGRQPAKSRQWAERALSLGQDLGDDHLCAYAGFALALAHINDLNVPQALAGWEDALVHARRAEDLIRESWTLHRMPLALTLLGRFDEADALAAKGCAITRRSHDWSNHSLGLSHLASTAVARGHFDEAERQAHQTMVMVSRSRYPWGGLRALLALACARTARGAWAEAEDALDVLVEPRRVFEDPGPVILAFGRVFRQLVRAQDKRIEGDLEALAADLMTVVGSDTYALGPLCALVELARLTGRPAIAELPIPALTRAFQRGAAFSSGWVYLIPRVLGVAAAEAGQWDLAETHFHAALDLALNAGARPELGHTQLDYAEMLIARGRPHQRQRALELVVQAYEPFAELGMGPAAGRAAQMAAALEAPLPVLPEPAAAHPDGLNQRELDVLVRLAQGRSRQEIAGEFVLGRKTVSDHVKRILDKTGIGNEAAATSYAIANGLVADREQGPSPPSSEVARPSQSLRIILVTDVAGSSAVIRRSGDQHAHRLFLEHNAIVRQCLAAHQGTEVAHTGDGIEASFDSASMAVECAVAIQRALARQRRTHPEEAFQVRIGINAGEPIATEGRLFGAAVHVAFRICARAQAGQILISEVVQQLVAGKGFQLADRGRVALKGLERVRLFEVPWEAGA